MTRSSTSAEGALSDAYRTPVDIFLKLEREWRRFQDAKNHPDVMDHMTNFCGTAWSLADWLWVHIHNNPALRLRAARLAGLAARPIEKSELQDYLLRSGPAMQVCYTLGTQAKHAKSSISVQIPSGIFATSSVASCTGMTATANYPLRPGQYFASTALYPSVTDADTGVSTLKLVVGPLREPAANTLPAAIDTWRQLLTGLGILNQD